MYGFGLTEMLILSVILLVLLGPIIITLLLRKNYPNRTWLGLLLSFIFAPFGHLYLKGGALYIILLIIFEILISILIKHSAISMLIGAVLSVGLMYFRFNKLGAQQLSNT